MVSEIVGQVCEAITVHFGPVCIYSYLSRRPNRRTDSRFYQAHGIPQCISAWMEHMEIQQPSTNSMDYMNRKGKSLNIQATRDYR